MVKLYILEETVGKCLFYFDVWKDFFNEMPKAKP